MFDLTFPAFFDRSFPTFESRKPLKSLCSPHGISPKAVLSILSVSDAVFPSLKQNFTQIRRSFKSAMSLITENLGSHLIRTTINTRWEATQRVMAAKLARLTCFRRPVRKLLDKPSYFNWKLKVSR
jgi:hypothetical protein